MTEPRIPLATYRLQFNRQFRFEDATRLVPYLSSLGITDLYASPIFKAAPGSLHGYDVTDHSQLNPELGTEEDFRAMTDALRSRDMGLIMDVVPNHMKMMEASNRWWQDVLENGPSSPYAPYFDIDWHPPKPDLANKVLLPVLGDQYGKVLEQGELKLKFAEGRFVVTYGEHQFPIAPRTSVAILEPALARARHANASRDGAWTELERIIVTLGELPLRTETNPEKVQQRLRDVEMVRGRLAELSKHEEIRNTIEAITEEMNGRPDDPSSFDQLEALLADQAYRLCYWRVAADEINYRRFFDVNELAAIRVEEPAVFDATHALILRLIKEGRVTGLRIDHPDGLWDPEAYVHALQARCREAGRACYLVVEKILCGDEPMPSRWPVHGTTGYEFLNLVNGLFVDPAGERALRKFYERLTGRIWHARDLVYESKKLILDVSMSSELHVLARRLDRISEQHRWSRDFTLESLQEALQEVIASFPVYRTYIQAQEGAIDEEDRDQIEAAIRDAKRRNPAMSESIFDFIASVLCADDPAGLDESSRAARREFVMRFQQLTAPVMAKGLEDTASYRAYPLASLNEVGGDPNRFAVSPQDFHARMAERHAHWPHALSASSTHDTKRGEDVRARLNVISELPLEWAKAVGRWRTAAKKLKTAVEGAAVPDANEEYLLYQTLVGTWPLTPMEGEGQVRYGERIERYMEKALREAKVHTSWVNPNHPYEKAVTQFVRRLLAPAADHRFLGDFIPLASRIAFAGAVNSLSQLLIKLAAPGTPDFYQGTELWEFSLVDPDNRRPVDFETRRRWLEDMPRTASGDRAAFLQELLSSWQDGRLKLWIIREALALRRRRHELFLNGAYVPLEAWGARKPHVMAFARSLDSRWVLVVVPRLAAMLTQGHAWPLGSEVWGDDAVIMPKDAPGRWRDVFTGAAVEVSQGAMWRTLPMAQILAHCPVALLESEDSRTS